MKKYFISTLTAIALAVPLGIGGLTLTAPVTATHGEAFIAAIRHHFNTCSRDVIWKCHERVQTPILFDQQYTQLFPSRAMPEGANGLDQKTFGTLEWQWRNRWGPADGYIARRYLLEFFPHPDNSNYYISPDDLSELERERLEAQRREEEERNRREAERLAAEQAAELEQLRRDADAFINHCQHTRRGDVVDATDDRSISCIFRVRYTNNHGHLVSVRRQVYLDELDDPVGFQITPINPLGSIADIEDIIDHRQVTSDNRGEIIELQGEVTGQEDTLLELEPVVARNVQVIEALGNSVGVLSEAVTGLAQDTELNAAGIALAYALDAPGLSYGKKFAVTGALGQFRGESAVGFSGTFKAGELVLISVGGGFAGSGDSSVTGGKISATYEW